jgi:hypothetical protein
MYYVTVGADSVMATGAPLPPFGKPLGKMKAADWTTMVERGIVQFGEGFFICYM